MNEVLNDKEGNTKRLRSVAFAEFSGMFLAFNFDTRIAY